MRRTVSPVLALAVLLFLVPLARAEKVDMTPEQLRKTATHVVTGEVSHIYTRQAREGKWQYTHYVAEIAVASIEKGEGLETGAPVYARYWTRRYLGRNMPPSTTGHRGIPTEGARIRVYLARNAYDGFGQTKDGGFNVIGANGFEALPPSGE